MKFTLSWLKNPLDTQADVRTIADTLTNIGLEVESVEDAGARLKNFTVAHVISAEKHPNADKLRLCMVDTGEAAPVQVICGAPNAHTGMKAVLAKPGTIIPATGAELKIGTIRGVINGPSAQWLQDYLKAVGLRPISALVDVTNFLSLDRRRPLHVFDAAKLKGDLRARLAKDGETLAALDGKTYTLDSEMVVI